jgi:hypothetical protein
LGNAPKSGEHCRKRTGFRLAAKGSSLVSFKTFIALLGEGVFCQGRLDHSGVALIK